MTRKETEHFRPDTIKLALWEMYDTIETLITEGDFDYGSNCTLVCAQKRHCAHLPEWVLQSSTAWWMILLNSHSILNFWNLSWTSALEQLANQPTHWQCAAPPLSTYTTKIDSTYICAVRDDYILHNYQNRAVGINSKYQQEVAWGIEQSNSDRANRLSWQEKRDIELHTLHYTMIYIQKWERVMVIFM